MEGWSCHDNNLLCDSSLWLSVLSGQVTSHMGSPMPSTGKCLNMHIWRADVQLGFCPYSWMGTCQRSRLLVLCLLLFHSWCGLLGTDPCSKIFFTVFRLSPILGFHVTSLENNLHILQTLITDIFNASMRLSVLPNFWVYTGHTLWAMNIYITSMTTKPFVMLSDD